MRISLLTSGFLPVTGLAALLSTSQLVACSDPVGPTPKSNEPVVIGVTMGSTGTLASITQQLRLAIRLAERQVNSNGGILNGRPLVFDIQDDTSSTDVSAESGVLKRTFDGLFDRRAVGAIGPIGSGQVEALGPLFGAEQRVVLSPSATLESLTSSGSYGGYFFRTAPSDTRQVKVLVNILTRGATLDFQVGSNPCQKLGVFYTNTPYSRGLAEGLKTAWNAASGGNTVDLVEPVPGNEPGDDFDPAVAFFKTKAPSCLAVLSYQGAASSFLRKLAGAEPTFFTALKLRVGGEALYSNDFVTAANQGIGTGTKPAELFVGAAPMPDRTRSSYLDWLRVLSAQDAQAASGNNAEFYFTSTYDAAILMALAAHKAKGQGGDELRKALIDVSSPGSTTAPVNPLMSPLQLPDALRAIDAGTDIDYDGASGDCNFDTSGNVSTGFQVWRVENDALAFKRAIPVRDLK